MPRTYERDVLWEEDIDVPDWELLDAAVALLRQQATPEDRFSFSAEDGRGTYRADALDEFRAEVEAADEPPDQVTFVYERHFEREPSLRYQLSLKRPGYIHAHTFVVVNSTDEGLAMVLKERTEALLRKASQRRKAQRQRAARKALAGYSFPHRQSSSPVSGEQQSWWEKWGVPLLITIVGTAIAALIVAAILGAFH